MGDTGPNPQLTERMKNKLRAHWQNALSECLRSMEIHAGIPGLTSSECSQIDADNGEYERNSRSSRVTGE